MEKIYIKNFIIDNNVIEEEKEISLYPLIFISNKYNYLANLIWYISDLHFFEFYKVNDYEIMSISKTISGIIEHYQYSTVIDNNMIIECIDFVNDILEKNKDNILNKLFPENKNKSIEKLLISCTSDNNININSTFNDESNIIDIVFIYNNSFSFSSRAFFSRKIDIFIFVIEHIIKILLTGNIYRNAYIADYNDFNFDYAVKKNMAVRDFIYKVHEMNLKENNKNNNKENSNIKNRYELIKMFFKHYNSFNIFIENFSLLEEEIKKEENNNDLIDLFLETINRKRNIFITYDDINYLNNLISDKRFENNIKVY
ncbi:hypothetical protein [Brachyspira sp. G79]|uniref:hypothetical protein n=1 Tax=Brachyspira sp. G79 TaxID=1358104 RepID=UPI000BBCB5A7|nr:hypothetical protein [Brachyspira sp. G79]PCG20784.1 hypothetical protein KQ44_12950 [Brachyspira sp. G79]